MKKSLLALAVLGTLAGTAAAQSSVTMYGRVDLSIGKNSGSSAKYMANGSGSRLGMRGVEDLGGGMKALFNIEHRFNADTGAQSNAQRFWTGRSIVGLEGGFGQVVLGREYTTAFLQSQLLADPWGWDTVASTTSPVTPTVRVNGTTIPTPAAFRNLGAGGTIGITSVGGIAKVRNDSSLTYKIAASGVTFGVQIAEASDTFNNTAKKPFNFAVSYAGGPLSLGFGYEKTGVETATISEKVTTFNGAYNFGAFKIGGFIGRGESAATGLDHKSYMLTATAPLGAGEFRAAFGNLDASGAGGVDADVNRLFALGYHYSLSKRTTIYADMVNNKQALTSKTGYDVGIKHNF
jgi:predicted porin